MVTPGPAEQTETLELPPVLHSPRLARHHTITILRRWQLGPELVETAELLVSEIVTNAIKASDTDSAQLADPSDSMPLISLTLRLSPDQLVIEVSDSNPESPAATDPDTDSDSGRGLQIAQAFSKDWGFQYLESKGKLVYCVLGIPDLASDTRPGGRPKA